MKSYIYSITDKATDKVVYVGSTKDFKRRCREHQRDIEKGIHKIKKLNTYKPEQLEFCVEYELDTDCSLVVNMMECFVNDLYKPYNRLVIKGFKGQAVTLARTGNKEFIKDMIDTCKKYY